MLKECLWHKWGSVQLKEEERQRSTGTRTSRMPAQAKFHDWTQVTYDHFGHFQNFHTHDQALTGATLLEGHIKRLGCSVTCGSPAAKGSWAAEGDWAVTGIQEVEGVWGVTGGTHQLTNKGRHPQWWATQGSL